MPDNSSIYELKYHHVWDRTTRLFHWINVVCIICLVAVGVAILNYKLLGVSNDGKILLKTIHAYIGYVFVLNLLWRLIWAFVGNKYSRWKSILPVGKDYWQSVRRYIRDSRTGKSSQYLGHNPVARMMVAFLFLLLTTQAVTGLVLAGTDLYLPPFGHEIAEWVTASGEDHVKIANLKPGSKDGVDPVAYAEMRNFRKPFINTHVYVFYLLIITIVVHIIAVVITEIREKNSIVSAMFTGKKLMHNKPVDSD